MFLAYGGAIVWGLLCAYHGRLFVASSFSSGFMISILSVFSSSDDVDVCIDW